MASSSGVAKVGGRAMAKSSHLLIDRIIFGSERLGTLT